VLLDPALAEQVPYSSDLQDAYAGPWVLAQEVARMPPEQPSRPAVPWGRGQLQPPARSLDRHWALAGGGCWKEQVGVSVPGLQGPRRLYGLPSHGLDARQLPHGRASPPWSNCRASAQASGGAIWTLLTFSDVLMFRQKPSSTNLPWREERRLQHPHSHHMAPRASLCTVRHNPSFYPELEARSIGLPCRNRARDAYMASLRCRMGGDNSVADREVPPKHWGKQSRLEVCRLRQRRGVAGERLG
jgi:hypothetical protein